MRLTDHKTVGLQYAVTALVFLSIPSVVLVTSLMLSLWGGSIRFTTPMLFALAFLPMFAWNIHYPGPDGRFGVTRDDLISASNPLGIDRTSDAARDDIGLSNILTVPVGRPVVVHLSSRDVVHSFTLNEMRVRQDATPGTIVHTWFTPTATGRWEIACSQLCGLGHFRMRGALSVLSADEWADWQNREVALIAPRQ